MNFIGSYGGDFLFHLKAVLVYIEHLVLFISRWLMNGVGCVFGYLLTSWRKGGSLLGNMVALRRA